MRRRCQGVLWGWGRWDFGEGIIIEEDEPGPYVLADSESYTITCYVQYGNDSSCIKSFAKSSVITYISDYSEDKPIVVFPTPAGDFINIVLENGNFDGHIALYDAAGRALIVKNITGNTSNILRIDVSSFPSGLYYINYVPERGKQSGARCIIMHDMEQ